MDLDLVPIGALLVLLPLLPVLPVPPVPFRTRRWRQVLLPLPMPLVWQLLPMSRDTLHLVEVVSGTWTGSTSSPPTLLWQGLGWLAPSPPIRQG